MAKASKRRLNFEIIGGNLSEAIEELENIRDRASKGELNEADFQIRLLHAYHHLNFAWNIRNVPTSQYAKLTDEQFERWGKYPSEIETL